MSGTFVACLVIAIIAMAFWRQTLVIAVALVIALLASGVSAVAQGLTVHPSAPSAQAPADPGGNPGPLPGAPH